MERESWKQIIAEQNDLPETDTGEYSLDEILLQFRLEYAEQETEDTMSRETATILTEEDRTGETGTDQTENLDADSLLTAESWGVSDEFDFGDLSDPEPASVPAPEESEHEAANISARPSAQRTKSTGRKADIAESLKSAFGKLRKRDRVSAVSEQQESAEAPDQNAAETPFDPISELRESNETWEFAEQHFPEFNMNSNPASEFEPETAESEPLPEQKMSEKPKRAERRAKAEEDVSRRRTWSSRRKRKVMEEFPSEPEEEIDETAAETDNVDYSSLFHMFTEESASETPVSSLADEEMRKMLIGDDDLFAGLEWEPTDQPDLSDADRPERQKQPVEPENTPLFAESTESSMDFRDILRDFMMGDQHPIYADMPGIGKKAEPVIEEPAEQPSTAKSAEAVPEKRSSRTYAVQEDFPLDLDDFSIPAEKPEETEETVSEASEPEPENANAEKTEDPAASEKPEKRLRSMLRGFGIRSSGTRKKALNEPKAYVSFEDYIQPETEKSSEAAEAMDSETDAEEASPIRPDEEESVPSAGEAEELNAKDAGDKETDEPSPEEDDKLLYAGDFPPFGQWILNELMTLWIRLNGIGDRESTATMEDDSEDLGKEVNVAVASRYYGSQVTMLRMRFQIGLVILAVLAYITLGFPVSGMLKTVKVLAAMCLGLQLTIMLLCLDVVTNAAVNLTRRRFGADGLAVLFSVITSFDALVVAVGGFGTQHVPLCLFSSLALMGILLSSLLSARALRKSTRVPAIGKRVYCVTAEEGVRGGGDLTLLKSVRPTAGFVRRAEEAPPDEFLFGRTATVQLLAAVALSLVIAMIWRCPGDLLYIMSALLTCAVPVTALLAFALPYFIGSQRIFSSGAAVAGWSGIHDIGCSRNLIVTDRDLFPEDTVAIETVRIFADDSAERIIGFAGTMIAASGSGLGACFAELMEKNKCRMRTVEDFRWLAGGGLQGRIEGHMVLCGNSDLMQLMNVKIPYRLVDRTTVLLAIDGVLYGIFKINYTGLPEIRTALQELIASNRHPIFAIRDFNVTPEMLHEVFDVATDGYDFPPYGDRFRISEAQPSETSKVSAVVCREGLGPLTHLADTGRSMYVAVRINLLITAAVAVLGMLMVFVRLVGTGVMGPWLPFVLMFLDAVIVTLVSLFMRF